MHTSDKYAYSSKYSIAINKTLIINLNITFTPIDLFRFTRMLIMKLFIKLLQTVFFSYADRLTINIGFDIADFLEGVSDQLISLMSFNKK